ncbi:hypothetical protein BDZ91DRAFT_731010 [Kalaharituber pfeilii]|nr:hypothetical protein BDZ91DRAFT_731010 [Kalaharituber pfeilii]
MRMGLTISFISRLTLILTTYLNPIANAHRCSPETALYFPAYPTITSSDITSSEPTKKHCMHSPGSRKKDNTAKPIKAAVAKAQAAQLLVRSFLSRKIVPSSPNPPHMMCST